MGVVAETAQRVQVMYCRPGDGGAAGRPRCSPTPRHPYTAALLDALAGTGGGAEPRLPTIPGMVPGIDDRPGGCLFAPRCRYKDDALQFRTPRRCVPVQWASKVRCHYPLDDAGQPVGWQQLMRVGGRERHPALPGWRRPPSAESGGRRVIQVYEAGRNACGGGGVWAAASPLWRGFAR